MSSIDHSTKLFNTAVIATKAPKVANYAERLNELVRSPAFRQIIKVIQDHAETEGLSEEQAAEEIIQTFRGIDELWDAYIFQEGMEKLKTHLGNA